MLSTLEISRFMSYYLIYNHIWHRPRDAAIYIYYNYTCTIVQPFCMRPGVLSTIRPYIIVISDSSSDCNCNAY